MEKSVRRHSRRYRDKILRFNILAVSTKLKNLQFGGFVGFIVVGERVVAGALGDAVDGTMGQLPVLKLKSSTAMSPR